MAKKWIQKAVSHPGRLTRAAKKAGVSKRAMADKWSHSSDASKRGAGNLGLRFMKGGDIHGGKDKVSPNSMKGEALMGRNANLRHKQAYRSGAQDARE